MRFLKKIPNCFCLGQQGLTLVEIFLMSAVLVTFAVGSTYLLVQSKVSMTSMSQTGQCPILAKDILDRFIGFGTRLYGYSYDASLAHEDENPKIRPLLIKVRGSYGTDNNIQDVGGHFRSISSKSQLAFPGIFENAIDGLYLKMTNMQARGLGSWVNTGVPIIAVNIHNHIELGSSVLLINTVNVLQYLYNSDDGPELFNGNHGKGKEWVSAGMKDDGAMKEYEKRFLLKNVKVYLKITPFEMKTNKPLNDYRDISCGKYTSTKTSDGSIRLIQNTSYSCPTRGAHKLILTRPHFSKKVEGKIPENHVIYGNPHIGFEIQVTVHYDKAGQTNTNSSEPQFMCDASQVFSHQMDTVKHEHNAPRVTMESVANGFDRDLMTTGGPNTTNHQTMEKNYTSCGAEGSDSSSIGLELDFSQARSGTFHGADQDQMKERGTVVVCQGVRGCRSGDSEDNYVGQGINCTYKEGPWQRCHQTTFPGQTKVTKAQLTGHNKLKLTFEELPTNARYDINVATLSTAGTLSKKERIARFYLDSNQPYDPNNFSSAQPGQAVLTDLTLHENVGIPTDGVGGRNYKAFNKGNVDWKIPDGRLSEDQWLQCNQEDVGWQALVEDQFLHNLIPCYITAERKDGTGKHNISGSVKNVTRGQYYDECNGTLSNIQHGRHTVTLDARDSCGNGWVKKIVWDTDLPETFEAKDLKGEYWFKKAQSPQYTIEIPLPVKTATTAAGEFPKHWTVDCFEKFWGPKGGEKRPDGDGKSINCSLKKQKNDIDDGCNPNGMGVQYYHVCGGTGHKTSKWAVYTPALRDCPSGGVCSCEHVQCEPELICCDGQGPRAPEKICGNYTAAQGKDRCMPQWSTSGCGNPRAGGNSKQDSQSQCPPLGLYTCTYTSDCVTSRGNDPSECIGKRGGDGCTIKRNDGCVDSNGNTVMCVYSGTCTTPSGGCTRKGVGGGTGQEQCVLDKIISTDDGTREPSDPVPVPTPPTTTPTPTTSPTSTTSPSSLPNCVCELGANLCDDSGGNHPAGDTQYKACCSKGYFHPYPSDDQVNKKYQWTCKPSTGGAGSKPVCKTSLLCVQDMDEPERCTEDDKYFHERDCITDLSSDGSKICVRETTDEMCWVIEDKGDKCIGKYHDKPACQADLPSDGSKECVQETADEQCWIITNKNQCTCGTARPGNQCGNGCIIRPQTGRYYDFWHSFNYDGNRYAKIKHWDLKWDCYTLDNSKQEIKGCGGKKRRCIGGYKRHGSQYELDNRGDGGLDGCSTCRNRAGYLVNRYLSSFGTDVTVYDNERSSYVGYCDKKFLMAPCEDSCSGSACTVAECYAIPRPCDPPCGPCQTCSDGRCVGRCTR